MIPTTYFKMYKTYFFVIRVWIISRKAFATKLELLVLYDISLVAHFVVD